MVPNSHAVLGSDRLVEGTLLMMLMLSGDTRSTTAGFTMDIASSAGSGTFSSVTSHHTNAASSSRSRRLACFTVSVFQHRPAVRV